MNDYNRIEKTIIESEIISVKNGIVTFQDGKRINIIQSCNYITGEIETYLDYYCFSTSYADKQRTHGFISTEFINYANSKMSAYEYLEMIKERNTEMILVC